jgi:O-antigen/teichoic acid export membrane protein
MANIRKQAILSSILVYIGFFIGAINTYFFTKQGLFTPEQFGLTRIFYDLGQNIYIFASLGLIPLVYKFYPYYKTNLPRHKIDLLTWTMCGTLIGFVMVMVCGFLVEPLVVKKFIQRSPLILEYYYYIYIFGFGMLFFSVLEAYCWSLGKSVYTNFLKETGMRAVVLMFIVVYYFGWVSFHTFVALFTFVYFVIFVATLIYLIRLKEFYLVFTPSTVTRRFKKKMVGMATLIYGGMTIQVIAQTIDTLIIASLRGLVLTGVFSLAQYAANLVQVPQRSMQSVTTGVLSQAWKDKNLVEINRIYHRTSINLLLMALFIFGNLWLNVQEGLQVLNIQADYQAAIAVIFILGLTRIIDAGTGVNGTIIATSVYWRFDFISGVIMLGVRIPLTYVLIKYNGIIGAAYAELFSFTLYNAIRFEFLRRKFSMQPFTRNTVYALAIAAVGYALCYLLLGSLQGWTGIILKTLLFSIVMIAGVFYLKVTPDAMQLWDKLLRRGK